MGLYQLWAFGPLRNKVLFETWVLCQNLELLSRPHGHVLWPPQKAKWLRIKCSQMGCQGPTHTEPQATKLT